MVTRRHLLEVLQRVVLAVAVLVMNDLDPARKYRIVGVHVVPHFVVAKKPPRSVVTSCRRILMQIVGMHSHPVATVLKDESIPRSRLVVMSLRVSSSGQLAATTFTGRARLTRLVSRGSLAVALLASVLATSESAVRTGLRLGGYSSRSFLLLWCSNSSAPAGQHGGASSTAKMLTKRQSADEHLQYRDPQTGQWPRFIPDAIAICCSLVARSARGA